jgi:hypothetical protein
MREIEEVLIFITCNKAVQEGFGSRKTFGSRDLPSGDESSPTALIEVIVHTEP